MKVSSSTGWKPGIQNNLDGQVNSWPPKPLSCSEKVTHEFKLLSLFFPFLVAHFILIEQSLPAGHRLPCHAFSLNCCHTSSSKATLCLATDAEKRKCFHWTFSPATFVRLSCNPKTLTNVRLLTSCSYPAFHSQPEVMSDCYLPPTL